MSYGGPKCLNCMDYASNCNCPNGGWDKTSTKNKLPTRMNCTYNTGGICDYPDNHDSDLCIDRKHCDRYKFYQKNKYKYQYKWRIIACDFDGTLFEDTGDPDIIGEPIWEIINALKLEIEQGSKTILWTARAGKRLEMAVKACEEVGITFDTVNDNIPEVKEFFKEYMPLSTKVTATEYWDDRSVSIEDIRRRRGCSNG